MNILVLGGTRFVGRHIVEAFLSGGHTVSILTRGKSPDDLPPAVERLHGDRDEGIEGLAALHGRSWDACIDVCGYTPRQVRASAELLRDSIQRYVFISTGSVYGDLDCRPVRETDPLHPPAAEDVTEVTNESYGPLKVTCENIVEEIYGERSALLRPQIVAGPYDPSGRHTYWVNRAARGGETLAPGDGSDHVQVIDARDLARFTVQVVSGGSSGAYNLAGPRLTWAEFIDAAGIAQPVWVSAEILKSAEVTFQELPLYLPEDNKWSSLMDVSNERTTEAGLSLTDPVITARDTKAWSVGKDLPTWLSPEREAELIRLARDGQVS